ncbi:GGDEF domain-containing protein [Novosphingobium jiangmenense]|uniref:diguanylate cyclase n=1 Tax=Novosphingobium jiangmenense TaxID=2791981 RepID=A0ABS0HI58_9SPHN|nr:GGDEF domain-containing protein [Novosphingobium jiangmenense]MBF9151934.1 GGDEF domain-containing protein [Novosphingobium jiangmenense]
MTHDPSARGSRSRLLKWLGLTDEEATSEASSEGAGLARDVTAREIWLPAKRRLLAKVADFLIDHDLEVMPWTLEIAYDCVTGAKPKLAQLILERTEAGQPITIVWLEQIVREQEGESSSELLAALMARLEGTLEDFTSATSHARSATTEYGAALQQHVDDLEQVGRAGAVITELAALAKAMMHRTREIEQNLTESERRALELQSSLDEARRVADEDHLTGLPNRRAFESLFEKEYAAAKASGEPLCVAFCDIDHFKRINDSHGHAAGDRVLKVVAETLSQISDARCHVARHGGEEFAVLFRALTPEKAWDRLDHARETIAERRLVNRATDMPFGRVTFSGGIADVFAYKTRSDALRAADEALYAAKQSGRNCVMMAVQTPPPLEDAA